METHVQGHGRVSSPLAGGLVPTKLRPHSELLGAGSSQVERSLRNFDKLFSPVLRETEGKEEVHFLEEQGRKLCRLVEAARRNEREEALDEGTRKRAAGDSEDAEVQESKDLKEFLDGFDSLKGKEYAAKLDFRCDEVYRKVIGSDTAKFLV